jgi:AcrR family transcriptional regulator
MDVSFQDAGLAGGEPRGARARTRKLMLETATSLMQEGTTPSVSDVAEAAGVSRATAYRYFPSQTDLVHAVVDEALGPILTWQSDSADAEERVEQLLDDTMPRIMEFEATFKAALKLSLDQWARQQAGTLGDERAFTRGHRVDLLQSAIAPLRKTLPRTQFQRLARALSLVYGLELLIVLKDLWGLDEAETQAVGRWAARALVKAAVSDAKSKRKQTKTRPRRGGAA